MSYNSNEAGPISWVFTKADLVALEEAIYASEVVVLDLETTGLKEHAVTGGHLNDGVAARVALATFTLPRLDRDSGEWDGVEPTTYILPLSHPKSPFYGTWRATLQQIAYVVKVSGRGLIGHNIKFDLRWIYATTGVDLADRMLWDTQVSSHLLDENSSTALKERAPRTFDIKAWNDGIVLNYAGAAEDADFFDLGIYGAGDTYWTWRLAQLHRSQMFLIDVEYPPQSSEEVEDARLGDLAQWVAMPTVRSLTRIENNGMRLDVEWVRAELAKEIATREAALDAMAARFGQDREKASLAATSKWFMEFASRAVDEGSLVIAAMTPNGNPQWSKSVLTRQARKGSEVAALILEGRGALKRAEYLSSWLDNVTPAETIHPTYWPGRVATGRLSSSDPNAQQITKALRPAFLPRDGYFIADLDYSQIELRVAAFLSQSAPMIEAYQRGDDLHTLVAARVAGKNLEDVTPEERQRGKAANFGLLYGSSSEGLRHYAQDAYGVEMSEEEAAEFHAGFFEQWKGLREWHHATIREVHKYGQVASPLGRVRRLPDIWSRHDRLVSSAERKAINSPVQGMASDLMQLAAASIQGLLPDSEPVEGLRLVATVHDSIVAEVPIDGWRECVEEAKRRMTSLDQYLAKMGVHLNIPLVADATVGTRWGLGDIHSD